MIRYVLAHSLVTAALVGSLGCASGSSAGDPLAPGSPPVDWVTPLLGGPPSEFVAFRAAAEPDWWSFAVHLPANAEYALYHSSQVDHYATAQSPDALVVIHDVPASLDPLVPVPPSTSSDLYPRTQTPSGVRAFVAHSPFFGATVIVAPPSTWFIVADEPTVTRLLAALDRRRPVPYLPLRPGAIAESFVRSPGSEAASWVPARDHKIAGGLVFYPPQANGGVPVTMKLVYDGDRAASGAASDLRLLWQSGALRNVDPSDGFFADIAGVQSDGATVLLRSYVDAHDARKIATQELF